MASSHFGPALATDIETRWCLRCLKWYAGKSKNKRGQECQELDFACSGASGEAVQSGTENYYSRLEKNDDKDDDSDSDDTHEHDVHTGSLAAEADTRPRRSVPTVNYSRSALYPAETLKAFRSACNDGTRCSHG
ncbi:hypothetical protein COL940_013948 [Colletotrichum noveboracense]|nr:hypothetical protein COL940_013948 [Colletotrichum noveboracense]